MLPRSLKRRAMSQNYYRIPIRIRYKSLRENDGNEKIRAAKQQQKASNSDIEASKKRPWNSKIKRAKTRKHRRGTKSLLNSYYKRVHSGYQWIETHIWHAKRFHMEELWGFKVPARCNDKCMRASYRYTQLSS